MAPRPSAAIISLGHNEMRAENETGTMDARGTEEKVGFWIGGSVEPSVGTRNQAGVECRVSLGGSVWLCSGPTGFWASESCVFQVKGEREKAWRYVVETVPPIKAARDLNPTRFSLSFFHLATAFWVSVNQT